MNMKFKSWLLYAIEDFMNDTQLFYIGFDISISTIRCQKLSYEYVWLYYPNKCTNFGIFEIFRV